MSIPSTQLAVVVTEDSKFKVAEIPVSPAEADEVLIEARAWSISTSGAPQNPQSVPGYDVSGVVVQVGKDVTDFKIGDQVAASLCGGFDPVPAPGAFSEYVRAKAHVSYKFTQLTDSDSSFIDIAPITTFESAAASAMAINTVGTAFYGSFGFSKGQDYSDTTILIWSAGSFIGYLAIQIAKWLGVGTVVATASPSKFEELKKIGATDVYDYHDPDVVKQIRAKYGDSITYGFDTFADVESVSATYDALSNTSPITVANLRGVQLDALHVTKKTNEVSYFSPSAFLSVGVPLVLFGNVLPVIPEVVATAKKFKDDIQQELPQFLVLPLQKVDGGLQGLAKENFALRVPNYKPVARAAESK